uniref:Uncharacterized protein n=1 Tax=mine drainage metagenome TaxID=410659 RepID=E6Q8W6_9ZZZZ
MEELLEDPPLVDRVCGVDDLLLAAFAPASCLWGVGRKLVFLYSPLSDISRFRTSVAVPFFNPLSEEETELLSGNLLLVTGSTVATLTCGST